MKAEVGLTQHQAQKCQQSPEAGRGKQRILPQSLWGKKLGPADTLLAALPIGEKKNSVVLSQPVCGNLLQRPQETNTSPQLHFSPMASASPPPGMENMRPSKAAQYVFTVRLVLAPEQVFSQTQCFTYLETIIIQLPHSFFWLESPSGMPRGGGPHPPHQTLPSTFSSKDSTEETISRPEHAQGLINVKQPGYTGNSSGAFLKQNKTNLHLFHVCLKDLLSASSIIEKRFFI